MATYSLVIYLHNSNLAYSMAPSYMVTHRMVPNDMATHIMMLRDMITDRNVPNDMSTHVMMLSHWLHTEWCLMPWQHTE